MRKQNSLASAVLAGLYLTREGRQALTADQLNAKGVFHRALEVGSIDQEKRTVELAFSSEFEGMRWFGIEILDHTPGSIELDRLRDGGALLVDHDWSDQVGVIESVSIGSDRVGRAVVRFGRSARANEIFQDIVDGIRRHVSVGYRVLEAKWVETRESDVDVYRITRWEPYEISIVSVPFDHSVGIGRDAKEIPQEEQRDKDQENSQRPNSETTTSPIGKSNRIMIKVLRNAAGDLVRAEVEDDGSTIIRELETLEKAGADIETHLRNGSTAENKRVRALLDMGDKYVRLVPKAGELARKAVADNQTVEQLSNALLEAMNERASKPLAEQSRADDLGLTDREIQNFSIHRAIRALLPNATSRDREAAAFERECSEAAQRQYGKEAKGILIPTDVLNRAFNAGGAPNTPTGAQSGANLVVNNVLTGSFIDMLRNRTTIMRLATTLAGLVGTVDIQKQTGGATGYWIGEGEDATEGTPEIGMISFAPKTVAAYSDLTRRLLMQSTPDAEGITRRDLANALAQTIDKAGYYGPGTGKQPRGLKNYTGINAKDFAATQPTFAELVEMETLVAMDNADIGQMGYVSNAAFRGHCKTTPKFGEGTESTIWESGGTVNGYRTEITQQIESGDVFFGNFADFIIAMWGGLDVTVDPYALSKSGGLRIVMFQDIDMNLRRLESICWGSAAVTP